jgi:hypothetical protein
MAAEFSADAAGGAGAGVLLLMLVVGVALGMMWQRFARSRRDLKGAKAFAKTAAKAHWRGSVPRLVLWSVVAACVVVATFRIMLGE